MTQPTESAAFDWHPEPQATALLTTRLAELSQASPFLQQLEKRLLLGTGTRLFDWLDTLHVAANAELSACGFVAGRGKCRGRWVHPEASLPMVVNDGRAILYLRTDRVPATLLALGRDQRVAIHGGPTASIRWATLHHDEGVEVRVVERHGDLGDPERDVASTVDAGELARWSEAFQLRARDFNDDRDAFRHTWRTIHDALGELGLDRTCELFFESERAYWQSRNDAAQMQKLRQDRLGLGWANHDHHTYRSSREHYGDLIQT
ncbi:MAG TPA: hypothetical protein VIY86_12175, partial [Pirellulaceae bacterium]